jgi:hypothetical protein
MTHFRSIYKSLLPNNLLLRFQDTITIEACSYRATHELLQQHAKLQDADGNATQELVFLEDRVDELLQDRCQNITDETLKTVTKNDYNLTSPLGIPWLLRYRQALNESTDLPPHDLINCPALVLLASTTQEIESLHKS